MQTTPNDSLSAAAPELRRALDNLLFMVDEFLPDCLKALTVDEFRAVQDARAILAKTKAGRS